MYYVYVLFEVSADTRVALGIFRTYNYCGWLFLALPIIESVDSISRDGPDMPYM